MKKVRFDDEILIRNENNVKWDDIIGILDKEDDLGIGINTVDDKYRREIESLFEQNYKNFKGITIPIKHEVNIRMKTDKIVNSKPRRLSWAERVIVRDTIEEMLKEGIIQESESEYSSPIVLVKKKEWEDENVRRL